MRFCVVELWGFGVGVSDLSSVSRKPSVSKHELRTGWDGALKAPVANRVGVQSTQKHK